jgi:hypothetical protein
VTSRGDELSLVPPCVLWVLLYAIIVRCHICELLKLIPEFVLPLYLLARNANIPVIALLSFKFKPFLTFMPVDDFLHPMLLAERQTVVLVVELGNIIVASACVVEGRGLNVYIL